ncbi:polyprenyl synthetase family protein [Lentzea sp. NBRC 105346]|uniref:polyprenyl synthetase family protein n=1 Tax=Lentzea sp. NBRC 105346 TaxID=3032205 RepID=UPI0025579888|nr:polyprenyl synthetase family protein [Lentzea sp. NBRC 105346]
MLDQKINDELASRWPAEADLLDGICRYALMPTGKLLRPVLLVESALAVGGRAEQVLPAAIGTEYGHTASLVHDDIIDNDELRRGRESVYHRFGVANAIVAGDALIFHLFRCLAECRNAGVPAARVVTALEVAAQAGIDLCRGQCLESEITENSLLDVDTYLRMIELKSAALFRSSCQCGAILGGGDAESVAKLGQYGRELGIAFQIVDDLFAFTGDSETTGKKPVSDVRNRRLTLPVLLAHEKGDDADRALLDEVFAGAVDAEEALPAVTEVLVRTGALDAARSVAWEHATCAQEALLELPESPSRDHLYSFATRAVDRVA